MSVQTRLIVVAATLIKIFLIHKRLLIRNILHPQSGRQTLILTSILAVLRTFNLQSLATLPLMNILIGFLSHFLIFLVDSGELTSSSRRVQMLLLVNFSLALG